MKQRFEGNDGRRLLVEALCKQDVVQQDETLAAKLASSGELVAFSPNADIVVQDDSDNSVYFLLRYMLSIGNYVLFVTNSMGRV